MQILDEVLRERDARAGGERETIQRPDGTESTFILRYGSSRQLKLKFDSINWLVPCLIS